ncbi:MAG: hypothetical protein RIR86_1840, partial [Acidobacteriota bacterium]
RRLRLGLSAITNLAHYFPGRRITNHQPRAIRRRAPLAPDQNFTCLLAQSAAPPKS